MKRPTTRSCIVVVLEKTDRATHETFDPRPQVDVLTLDSLGILLADCMLLRGNMALVCPPSIGVKPRDPKRLQEILKFKKNRIHLPDIMPPKVEPFTRCTSHPRNGHATCSLWRCPSCLPCSAPLPTSRAGALSSL